MTWNPAYPAEPTNPPPLGGPDFDVAVRRSFQGMGRVDVTPYGIPWSGIDVPLVDALPVKPNDRAEVNYVADADVVWRLVYLRSDNKWHYIGGPPLYAEVATNEQRTTAAYGDLATVGPSLSIARTGTYDITASHYHNNSTAGSVGYMSYFLPGTSSGALDADALASNPGANAAMLITVGKTTRIAVTSTGTLTAKYYVSGSVFFGQRRLLATPVTLDAS